MNISYWCNLTDAQLSQHGIAAVNMAAAVGLPSPVSVEVPELLKKLDDWTDIVDHAVRRMWKRRLGGESSDLTGRQFKIMVMITTLQRNLGVTYNFAFSEGEYDASDSRNLFLHGLLTGHGGTCVTMPVLYAAIGRRLGFPIKIVRAKQHVFCRWDGEGERFNIEATSPGFNSRPDEYYHTWPVPISREELEAGWFLKSLTPMEELADFIGQRGNCLLDHLRTQPACQAHGISYELSGRIPYYRNIWSLSLLMHRAVEHLRERRKKYPNEIRVPSFQPREEWEKKLMPFAEENLDRIFRNKQKRDAQRTREQAIQPSVR